MVDAGTNVAWRAESVPAFRGYAVEWAEPGRIIVSRREQLFECSGVEPPQRRVAAFPQPPWRRLAARVRLAQRALRYMYYNVLPLADDSLFVTFGRQIGKFVDGAWQPVTGLKRPTRVLRSGCARTPDGDVYFGEYIGNVDRGEIHIYRLPAGETELQVVHTFAPKEIRHVHGVYQDPFDPSRLWLGTGDLESECQVATTTDGFRTLDVVGTGDETWRCVSLAFTKEFVYYGSDGEFAQNYLYRIDRDSGARTQLAAVDGPVYYAASTGDDVFLGVTAELCPSQVGRSAAVWNVQGQDPGQEVLSHEKDFWPGRYFLPGTWHFPAGPGLPNQLFVSGVALRGADHRTFCLKRATG